MEFPVPERMNDSYPKWPIRFSDIEQSIMAKHIPEMEEIAYYSDDVSSLQPLDVTSSSLSSPTTDVSEFLRFPEAETSKQECENDKHIDKEKLVRKSRPNKHRKRRRWSAANLSVLESTFKISHTLSSAQRTQLASQLGAPPHSVYVWFQNRRARLKKEMKLSSSTSATSDVTTPETPSVSSSHAASQDMSITLEAGRTESCESVVPLFRVVVGDLWQRMCSENAREVLFWVLPAKRLIRWEVAGFHEDRVCGRWRREFGFDIVRNIEIRKGSGPMPSNAVADLINHLKFATVFSTSSSLRSEGEESEQIQEPQILSASFNINIVFSLARPASFFHQHLPTPLSLDLMHPDCVDESLYPWKPCADFTGGVARLGNHLLELPIDRGERQLKCIARADERLASLLCPTAPIDPYSLHLNFPHSGTSIVQETAVSCPGSPPSLRESSGNHRSFE